METNFTQGHRVFEYHVYYISIYNYCVKYKYAAYYSRCNGQWPIRLVGIYLILIICFTVNSILNIVGWLILGYNLILLCIQRTFQGFFILLFSVSDIVLL